MPVQLSPETRVPRQVAERAARALERYKPAEPDPLNPAAVADPASPPAAAAATTVDPQVDPRHSDPAYWKARFDVTSGLLTKERADRSAERLELNRQNAALQEKLRQAPTASAPAEINLSTFFTPQQIETYGEEQCRVMAQTANTAAIKNAQELITAEVRPLKEENERREAERKAEAQTKFEDTLTAAWPLWRAEDLDQKWRDWLAEEGDDGAVRQQVLNIHIANRDVPKIMRIRKVFEKLFVTPPVPVPPITPSGGGAAPTLDAVPASREDVSALTYPSQAEVKDFYKRSALGKVKDDERTKFEARLKLGPATRR
jgi:hypothetical protein